MATTDFNVNQDDLAFILRNIKVAEAHSGGMSLTAAIQAAYGVDANDANILPAGLRTVSGAYNNLAPGKELWGAADTAFPRITDPAFVTDAQGSIDFDGPGPAPAQSQGDYSKTGNVIDSAPRTISNLIVNQTIDNPAAVAAWFANPLTLDAFHDRYGPNAIPVDPKDTVISITDASFEATSLAVGAPGVISDTRGNYTTTAPSGWTIAGGGGLFAPSAEMISASGHTGGNVAYLQGGSVLSQTMTGVVLATGGAVNMSLNIGDRTDMGWTGGEARLVDTNGNVLATVALPDPGDGQWSNVTLTSGPIPTTSNGLGVRIEIANTGSNQILIDNVAATVFGPNEIAIDNIDIANIPNQSPDIGLSPGFNSWMTFFGQFFDHGLDLVTKAENGTVYIPLNPDDPLIAGNDRILGTADDLSPNLRFMAVTRAKIDANGNAENTTTPFIDQNQTYTSHPSHHVFLREYVMGDAIDGKGLRPLSTGHLLDGQQPGTIATWADIKAQAASKLGILLNDFDAHNAPLLVTDEYGEFVRGPNGYPMMVMTDGTTREGNPAAPITTVGAVLTGHQFLVDIAHHAAPGTFDPDHNPGTANSVTQIADFDRLDVNGDGQSDQADVDLLGSRLADVNSDGVIDAADLADVNLDGVINAADLVADDHNPFTYDNEMLDAHYVTGDGRGNENIALTAVHSVFHAEHNRLVEENKLTILKSAAGGDLTFLNEWLLVHVTEVPADTSTLLWDGERMFQAARFVTEMQYQHLVFEEFARRIQPNVDPFVFTNTPDMDPSIIAEFAHTVYRFGHSMLNDTVDRLDNNLNPLAASGEQATLIEAFLNPQMFAASGADVSEIIANVVRGAVGDVGNEIDEFVVPALQSNLLGLPLDLAAINIARGRETGIKSLNEIRKELYHDYGLADLKPYTSWLDFAQHMKHPQSLVNFIAAYGTHATITNAETLEDKRAAAWELITGRTLEGAPSSLATADRLDFLQARGAYATTALGGMNNVDLWIGGLAEELNEFGGMLGSTFNFIFEYQLEHLQTGDRFYYLSRTQGTNLLNQLEPNTFTDLVMRNSDLSDDYATHLNGTLFTTPDYIFELDRGIAERHDVDPEHDDPFLQMIDPKVVRIQSGVVDANGHDVGGTLKFSGGEHVVLGGTEGKDTLYGDKGIDTLWGDGDDDYLNAGMESDNVFGGAGDDIIEDPFGDDVLRGGAGDDVISAGTGLDLIFGDEGSDFIIMGMDDKEAFGGEDNDFMLGGTGNELVQGGEGDDWLEGGDGFDTLAGDNSQLFFNSTIVGHDVMWGQGNDTDYDGESGDDIMLSGPGIQRFNGMFGFDWAIAKHDTQGVDFDFGIPLFVNDPGFILRDRFDLVEGGSGWKFDDVIAGDDRGNSQVDIGIDAAWEKHTLDRDGIDRIAGLAELLEVVDQANAQFRDGNILLGGDGNDRLQGNGGYDVIDGDAWMNVRLAIAPGENGAPPVTTAESLAELVPYMLNGTIKPSQISIVREILYDQTPNDNIDTAVYRGSRAEYLIEGADTMTIDGQVVDGIGIVYDANNDGFISIMDLDDGVTGATVNGVTLQSRNLVVDDTDRLKNIERLEFADQTVDIGPATHAAFGTVTINDPTPFDDGTAVLVTPYVGQTLTATLTDAFDIDGLTLDAQGNPIGLTFEWQQQIENGNTGWQTIGVGLTHVVQPGTAGQIMRAVAVFKDNSGVTERIASGQTDNVELPLAVNENATAGTVVALRVPFDAAAVGVPSAAVSHVILPGQDAGGRFQIIQNGVESNGTPRYSIVVANPAPVMDYERQDPFQTVDNQYQIVVQSIDTRDGTIIDTRQLTILLNDVAEAILPPSDLHLNVVDQADATLPGIGLLGTLSAVDDNHVSGFTYRLVSGGPDFAVTAAGEISRLNTPLAINSVYEIAVEVRAPDGLTRTETITIQTGSDLVNTITLTGTNDHLAFGGQRNDVITGSTGDDEIFGQAGSDRLFGGDGNDRLSGGSGVDSIFGDAGNDVITGDLNNDSIFGGAGDDTIIWNALNGTAADGRDFIDGGDNGAGGDTFVVNGRADRVEQYRIYTVVEAIAAGATGLSPNTEIVITRGNAAVFNSRIIAELDNIEEIVVDMAAIDPTAGAVVVNGSRVDVIGDFTTTSLRTSTIHIEGGAGADTVDFSALTSIHRIVFNSNGGVDTVIGEARQQDVIDVVLTSPLDVEVKINGSGVADELTGDARIDIINGLGGNDILTGMGNDDRISGGSGDDRFVAGLDDGNDYYKGGSGSDTLDMSMITANITANLNGGSASRTNIFSAQTGDDSTISIENIVTGNGNDTIIAGNVANVIDGGTGADTFSFGSAKAANGDTLLSFEPGDRIDLSGFDANTGVKGVQQFTLVTDAITDRGQILVSSETRDDGIYTVVSGNVSGDTATDFKIGIKGQHDLTLSDFTF